MDDLKAIAQKPDHEQGQGGYKVGRDRKPRLLEKCYNLVFALVEDLDKEWLKNVISLMGEKALQSVEN